MSKFMAFCCLTMIFIWAAAFAAAQGNSSLSKRIERVVKEREPGWELKANRARKTAEEDSSLHEWKIGNKRVTVAITTLPSSDVAANNLRMSVHSIAIGRAEKLPNLGDEAYIWTGDAAGWGAVHLRHGASVVIVNAPSAEVAKRFARHVVKQLGNN